MPDAPRSHLRSLERGTTAGIFLLAVLSVCTLGACVLDFSGDDENGEQSDAPPVPEACGWTTTLTGAVELDVDLGASDGCGGQGAVESVVMGFGTGSNPVSITLELDGVVAGQRAVDTAATVSVTRNPDGARWRTPTGACTVELTRNALDTYDPASDASTYLLAGTGACEAGAVALDTDEDDVEVGAFSFAGAVVWPGTGG